MTKAAGVTVSRIFIAYARVTVADFTLFEMLECQQIINTMERKKEEKTR